MAYEIEIHLELPVLSNTLGERLDPGDVEKMTAETNAALDSLDRKVYFVIDMSHTRMTFEDVVAGASAGARGVKPPLHHPNIIETIIITSDNLVKMAIQGMSSSLFGNLRISTMPTRDEALAHVREKSTSV